MTDEREKFLQPDEVTLSPEEAAPHLGSSSGGGTEWREATDEDLYPTGLTEEEKKWPHEWHSLCWMLASGASQTQCAKELGGGYTAAWISTVANKPAIVQKIEQIRKQHWGDNLERRFAKVAPKAMDLATQIIEGTGVAQNAKVSERWDAAKWLLEKVTGKPEAKNEKGTGETVLQILQTLDQLKQTAIPQDSPQVREVRELAEGLTKEPDDWMTTWVTEHTGEGKK